MGRLIDRQTFAADVHEGRYVIQPGQVLSPMALELAREQGIEILRADAAARPAPDAAPADLSARISQRFARSGVQPDPALIETVRREVEAMARQELQGSETGAAAPGQTQSPQLLSCLNCDAYRGPDQKRIVVTSAGRNRSGVVARIAAALADCQVDIVDLSQTLVGEFFTMIIVADIAAATIPFESIRESLLQAGKDLGVHVAVMNDQLLRSMHRV